MEKKKKNLMSHTPVSKSLIRMVEKLHSFKVQTDKVNLDLF